MSPHKISSLRRIQINYLLNLKETRIKRKKLLFLGKVTFELTTLTISGVDIREEFKPVYLSQANSAESKDKKIKTILNNLSLKLDFYTVCLLIALFSLGYLIIVYLLHATLAGGSGFTSDSWDGLNFATSVITQTLSPSDLSLGEDDPRDLRLLAIQRLVKEILIL